MEPPIRPLMASLHEIPDRRSPRGRRHPLAAMLGSMCVALRWGSRRDSAIANWGRCYGQQLAQAMGLTHAKTPCAATASHVLHQLDGYLGDAILGAWAEGVLRALPPAPGELKALAIDGNTQRGSRRQGHRPPIGSPCSGTGWG
jgi:hypothetical protein